MSCHLCRQLLGFGVFVLLLSAGGFQFLGAQVTYSDGIFNNAGWALATYNFSTTSPGGGTSSGTQSATGGNPGMYRLMSITVGGPVGQASVNGIYSYNLSNQATYNPSIAGPIDNIDCSADVQTFSYPSTFSQEWGLVAFQNNTYFFKPTFGTSNSSWLHSSSQGIHHNDFFRLLGSAPTLDFSAAAPPITFGYYGFYYTQTNSTGYTVVAGVDNFSVTVNPLPIPEPACLGIVALAAFAIAPRRNRKPSW